MLAQQKVKGADVVINSSFFTLYNLSQYLGYYYDVLAKYETDLRQHYTARSGCAGFRLAIDGTWRKNNYWIGIFTQYSNIDKASFEHSPLVKKKHNLLAGIAVSYIFLDN